MVVSKSFGPRQWRGRNSSFSCRFGILCVTVSSEGLLQVVSSQITMEQHGPLFWGSWCYSSYCFLAGDYLASNRPVLVCVGKAFQKPPTPGVLQACRMNCDCCITTIKKKYLITLTAAQSGRTVTEIFPLWMCSERPFVTSLLLIVLVSKVAGLLPFTFSSWSIGDI